MILYVFFCCGDFDPLESATKVSENHPAIVGTAMEEARPASFEESGRRAEVGSSDAKHGYGKTGGM